MALGALAAVDGLHGFAFLVLGPDIARTLGISVETVAALGILSLLSVSVGALPIAALAARRQRRAALSIATGGIWSVGSALTSFVTGPWALAGLLAADGAATGSVRTLHPALIADGYHPAYRVRALAWHRAFDVGGVLVAPALVAILSAAGLTWRGIFLVLAGVSLVAVAASLGLRDPGVGAFEPERVRTRPDALEPTTGERVRELLRVPTIRRILLCQAVLGVFLAPLIAHLFFFLEGRWLLDAQGRGWFFAGSGAVAVLALALLAGEGERRLRTGPDGLVRVAWPLFPLMGAALVGAATASNFGIMVAAFCGAMTCLALAQTAILVLLVTLAPPEARTHASALSGIALAGVGGVGGLLLMAGAESTLGLGGSLAFLAVPAGAAGLVLRGAAATASRDLRTLADEIASAKSAEATPDPPLLSTKGLVCAYGENPVLHGIDVAVEHGELLAVLGTNGAGKSTLLKALAGLLPPASGRVHLEHHDITYLDPERRARLGLSYVGAADATFGPLSVRDSLRVAARATGLGRRSDHAVGKALERFPALGRRASVPAAAISEGERRMLALAQALLLKPRLLLLDEPSRGLAPGAVSALVALVRELRDEGVAIVLVEQSLDVAMAVASRALFLERGTIRFAGSVEQLRERDDLLRPVFLTTAATARGDRA